MKKLFLLSAAVLLSASSFAQAQFAQVPLRNEAVVTLQSGKIARDILDRGAVAPAARHLASNGVYYTRPAGSFYTGTTSEGYGYYVPMVVVPPAFNVVFTNQSTNKAGTTWTVNGTAQPGDADNNFSFGQSPSYTLPEGRGYYTPVLHSGSITFNIGQTNEDYASYGPGAWTVDTVPTNLAPFNSGDASTYAFGAIDHIDGTDTIPYLFGTGDKLTFRDGTQADLIGILQPQNAPARPLYVENIHAVVYTHTNAISGNGKLTLYVIKANADFSQLSDTIATLTATASEVSRIMNPRSTAYGTVAGDMVTFLPKTAEGDDAPFVIDSPYVIALEGFKNAGVDVDLMASEEVAEDNTNPNIQGILSADGETWAQVIYNGNMVWNFSIYGGFDNVNVADTLYTFDDNDNITGTFPNMNVLRVSADGQTVSTDGTTAGGDNDLGGAYVSSALSYYDEDGNSNYYADYLPEWISDLSVQTINDANRTYLVTPVCDPLPAGQTGRAIYFNLVGKGATSSAPIYVLQGDATIDQAVAAGINSVSVKDVKDKKDNRIFNLAGQQVTKSYKGIVISNGEKYIQK